MNQFLDEYWMFVEALLTRSADLLGVSTLNHLAAALGHPFAAALALSCAGFTAALAFLSLGRPGWGLAGLAVGEELSALSLASAAVAHGLSFDGSIAIARLLAGMLAVCLISAMMRKALRSSPEKVPAAR
jgi:hypothetical protein